MSWEKFLRDINTEKGGVGLGAIQKAKGMGASKADINAYLERKDFTAGKKAQKAGFGKITSQAETPAPPSWEDFLKGINTEKGVLDLSALQQAEGMGVSKDQLNQFLGTQGYKVGDEARKVGYGPALTPSGPGTQPGVNETSGTKYATDLDKYLAGIGTEVQGKINLQKIVNAGYSNIARIERGSDMFRSIMGAFNF